VVQWLEVVSTLASDPEFVSSNPIGTRILNLQKGATRIGKSEFGELGKLANLELVNL